MEPENSFRRSYGLVTHPNVEPHEFGRRPRPIFSRLIAAKHYAAPLLGLNLITRLPTVFENIFSGM
jgi:hypothetical protein